MERSYCCEQLREHFDQVKLRAIERFITDMNAMDVEEVCRKIMEGDLKFGPLDLQTLRPLFEFHGEVVDSIAYMLFAILYGQQADE